MRTQGLGAGVVVVVMVVVMVVVVFACGQQAPQDDAWSDASLIDAKPHTFGDGAISLPPDAACDSSIACSADLHHVIDCHGMVLQTCKSDMGCFDGTCIPACEAAERTKSSYGCEYFSVDPAEFNERTGSCFAAYVVNTWNTDITLGVEFKGEALSVKDFARIPKGSGRSITYAPLPNDKLPPGEVAILFLAHHPSEESAPCPPGIAPAVSTFNVKLTGTGITDAFIITADRPVAAYDIYPYGGGNTAVTSATLLIPTSAWGINYMAQSPYTSQPGGIGHMEPFLQVVAKEAVTRVTINPSANIIGNDDYGVPSGARGEETAYRLDRGQVLQLSQADELTGSIVASDQPVGLWGGQNCIFIEPDQRYCDSAHQQLPPISALGNEYIAVAHRDRLWYKEENPPWRVVGIKDGTILTYLPDRPAGAPTVVNQAQVSTFFTNVPFIVSSQDMEHPFYVSAHMTGGSAYAGKGDPEWVNVIPSQQYLSRYTFFTDPTYPETSLVLVRENASLDSSDVELDCAGPLTNWVPVDANDRYEYARIDLTLGAFESQNGCDNGVHSIWSAKPFGLTVWGWGNLDTPDFDTRFASYAYPGGAGVRLVTDVVVSTSPIPH